MSLSFQCPECGTQLRMASAPPAGTQLRCPKCQALFRPKFAAETPDRSRTNPARPRDEEEETPRSRKTRPGRDDEEDSPRSRSSRPDRDDEEDGPRSRRSRADRYDDEDEDDRRRRSKKKKNPQEASGLPIGLLAGGGVVVLVLVVLAVWLAVGRGKSNPSNDVASTTPDSVPVLGSMPAPTAGGNPAPSGNPNTGTNANTITNTNAIQGPTSRQVADLSPEILNRTKRATAFIQVEVGNVGATGSGFLVRSSGDTAYLVTNHHVIAVDDDEPPPTAKQPPQSGPSMPRMPGMPGRPQGFPGRPQGFPGGPRIGPGRPPSFGPNFGPRFGPAAPTQQQAQTAKAKRKVTVVLDSGTAEEQTIPAEVVAIDGEVDLAVLRITGVRNLPPALDTTQDSPVAETLPVYIFGFPGGRKGKPDNPVVTIGKGTIAGLRRDEKNQLNDVHINGDLNPGNSGGPVVDAQGRLVGVSVATVMGKQIGFAIPTTQLNEMFKGSVSHTMLLQARQQGNRVSINGELWLFDRNSKVRENTALNVQIDGGGGSIDPNEFVALARLTDPMLKLNSVFLHYTPAQGGSGPANPGPAGWAPLPNAQRVAFKISDQSAEATFKLPAGSAANQSYAFQVSYVNAEGRTIYTQPHTVQLNFPPK
jgi:predicted Zn finger-like uncharacterized protein